VLGAPTSSASRWRNCCWAKLYRHIAHSKTRDLAGECRRAEILVAAVGRPKWCAATGWRPAPRDRCRHQPRHGSDGKSKLVGDVAFAEP